MKVAGLQLCYRSSESRSDRIERVLDAVDSAPDCDLLVLPELWDVGYFAFDDYEDAARDLTDALTDLLELTAGADLVLVAGSVLERDGADLHNTCAVLGGARILGTYRKRHLFAYGSREAELLTPGSGSGVVETPLGRLGVATCFDLRFPEQFAEMRAEGADVFVVPAAWPVPRAVHWDVLVRARAIDTQTPMVAINGTGTCEGVELAGGSLILDARGNVLTSAGKEETWLEATLDPADTIAWRNEFPIHTQTAVAL